MTGQSDVINELKQEIRPAKEDIENHKINTKLVHDENETLAHKIKKMSHELNELKLIQNENNYFKQKNFDQIEQIKLATDEGRTRQDDISKNLDIHDASRKFIHESN